MFPLPDDYQFCAPVKNVGESEMGGVAVWKLRSTVMRIQRSSQEIDSEIYSTREGLRGRTLPTAGDTISETPWLPKSGGRRPLRRRFRRRGPLPAAHVAPPFHFRRLI
jgi:hypothetical protein